MKTSGIYKITCVKNGNFYIGRTSDYTKRIRQHKVDLKGGKHKNQRMQHCYNKYGADSFVYELIIKGDENTNLIDEEQRLIDLYIDQEECMNINRSAKVFCDVPMTAERRAKISAAHKGKICGKRTEEHRKHISDALKGHKISEETKKKISESHKGKVISEEAKEKLRIHFSGKGNPMYGRTGSKHPFSVPVWQVEPTTGEKINRFESATEAAQSLGKKDGSHIRKMMKRNKTAYGYYWIEDEKGASTSESNGNIERVV